MYHSSVSVWGWFLPLNVNKSHTLQRADNKTTTKQTELCVPFMVYFLSLSPRQKRVNVLSLESELVVSYIINPHHVFSRHLWIINNYLLSLAKIQLVMAYWQAHCVLCSFSSVVEIRQGSDNWQCNSRNRISGCKHHTNSIETLNLSDAETRIFRKI